MNQEKIGKFIAMLRKDKKITQQELANMLNVTDRAVSHWENGRRLPDISLFKPICEIFNITVNELISGELIPKEKMIKKSDENIIETLNNKIKQKKKMHKIIIILLSTIIFLIIVIVFGNKELYPKIDIDNFSISLLDTGKEHLLEKELTKDNRTIYFYGVDTAFFCDRKDNCYQLKSALKNKQTTLDKFQEYLEKEVEYENIETYKLFDGGTTIYKKSGFLVVYCNTIDGNHDIYIGNSEMLDKLNGEYCGHPKSTDKSFIRTYKIISATVNEEDFEFNDIILEQNNKREKVTISNTFNLIPGKIYEFSFLTFKNFEDTIRNIFKYSTIIKVVETDKEINEYINEDIFVNEIYDNESELNQLDDIIVKIKEGSLTTKSAIVIVKDYTKNKYLYGDYFRLDKKENGNWQEVENKCDNCFFNSIGYLPDINGYLQFEINWEKMYGQLEKGKYRIVKTALINNEECAEEKCNTYYFSVEFDIN